MIDRYDEIYYDLALSMQKFVLDLRPTLATAGFALTFLDWDEHAEIEELPDGDLIGPSGLGLSDEEGLFEAVISIGISTQNDQGLFRIRKMAARVFAALRPTRRLQIYRAATNAPLGWMVMASPVVVTPMSNSATRNLLFVNARGMVDPSLPNRE